MLKAPYQSELSLGKGEIKSTPLTNGTLHMQSSSVALNQVLAENKSDTRSFAAGLTYGVGIFFGAEELIYIFLADPNSRILDTHHYETILLARKTGNGSVSGCKIYSIRY